MSRPILAIAMHNYAQSNRVVRRAPALAVMHDTDLLVAYYASAPATLEADIVLPPGVIDERLLTSRVCTMAGFADDLVEWIADLIRD